MTSKNTLKNFRLMPVAAAVLAVYGNANAQQTSTEVKELITPDSVVSLGVGNVNHAEDARRFGEYTGLNKKGAYGLVDFGVVKRDEATGTWTIFTGRDLGLDTRELGFLQQKQGDWKYALDYNEIVRNEPFVVHTGMTGIGTASPTINLITLPSMPSRWATANGVSSQGSTNPGTDVDLKLKRDALGIGGSKWITPELQLEASFRNEDKKGSRLFGRVGINSNDMIANIAQGTGNANGRWAVLLTPEPIDSTIRQFDLKLNFTRDKLALSGGYYGSFYTNNFGSLTPNAPGTLNRGVLWNGPSTTSGVTANTIQQVASSAVALPPDNQAHQFYLTGTYAISPTTRTNFKVSYTHATQDEGFGATGLAPAPGDSNRVTASSLDGVVNTTLAQWDLIMRPSKALSVNGSLRYEDRDDRTAINIYNNANSVGLNNTTNWPSASQTRTSAKLEGTYRLPDGYLATLGADWERIKRPVPPSNSAVFSGQVLFRPVLNEYGVRADLRRSMTESVNAAVGLEYKQRRGYGDWVTTSGVTNASGNNALIPFDPTSLTTARTLPVMYMDRNRTKAKASVDWLPTDKFSVQGVVEHAQDSFNRDGIIAGARTMVVDTVSLDASYVFSENWKMSGYWTGGYNRWDVNKSSINGDVGNHAETFGLGLKGKISARVDIGADLLMTRDTTTFVNTNFNGSAVAGFNPATGGTTTAIAGNFLPDIHYTTSQLKLFGNYAVSKSADVRVDLIYQHFKTDDWEWGYNGVPFLYSDNTTVSQPTSQNLVFIGARYIFKFQ